MTQIPATDITPVQAKEQDFSRLSKKFGGGYVWDSGSLFLWEMHYDENGNYTGQTQEDVIDGGTLFFKPTYNEEGLPCVDGKPIKSLTKEEMSSAE